MSGHLASEAVDAEKQRLQELLKAQYDADLRFVMGHGQGRRFVARLLFDTSGIMALSFVPGVQDATSFNEGKRAVGIFLANECRRVAGNEFVTMQEEQFNEAREREIQSRRAEEEALKDE